ncbi:MAG: hypothetical protein WD267_01420, partial [Balneolales bacterium]
MIVYYLLTKLKVVFSPRNNIWGVLALALLIPVAILYGIGVANLMDESFFELTESMIRTFEMGLPGFIAVITFLRGYFPSYKPIRSHFKSFHPISPLVRFMLNILGDFISVFFITIGSFIGALYFFSTTIGLEYTVYLILALTGAHILRRCFQTIFEYKFNINRRTFSLLFICTALILLFMGLLFIFEDFTFWISIGGFISILLTDLALEELCPKERTVLKSTGNASRNLSIDLLLRNKIVRTTLLVAMIFKVVMLSLDLIIYLKTGVHFANNIFIFFLFISPLIIFTYLFNNSWGYFRNYWLFSDRAHSTGQDMFNMYLKILWLPLSTDFTISMTFLILSPADLLLPGISMYMVSLFVLTVGGFFWSIQVPVRIEKIFAFKANTSTLGSIFSIGVVSSFLALFISDWFYL